MADSGVEFTAMQADYIAQLQALVTYVETCRDLIAALQAGTGLADGSVAAAKLEMLNGLANGYVPVYNSAAGKFEMQDISGVVGADTYQVKLSAGLAADYLGNLLGTGLEVSAGLLKAKGIYSVVTATTTAQAVLTSTPTLLKFTPTGCGEAITLPDATTCTEGGPLHIIDMSESVYPVRVLTSAGVFRGVFFPGTVSTVSLPDNSAAAGPWAIENIKRVGPVAQLLTANMRGNIKVVDLGNNQELILATNASSHLYGVVYDRSDNSWGAVTSIRAAAVVGNYSACLCAADKVLIVSAVTTALEAVVLTIAAGDISAVGTADTETLSAAISYIESGGSKLTAIGDAFVCVYRVATPAMEIRSITVAGTTPTIGAATVLPGTAGGYLSFTGSVAVVATEETSAVHVAPYTISGSAAPVIGTKVSDSVTSGGIFKFKKMPSGRWLIIYLDNGAVIGGFATLAGTIITTSIVPIFAAASGNLSDAWAVEADKVLCTTAANSSPCYNILTDTAGTASAGTAIDIEAVALTRTCLYADGTDVVVYAFSATKFHLQTIDCSGASPVLGKTSGEISLASADVAVFYQSDKMMNRYPAGLFGEKTAYRAPTSGPLCPQIVDGNLSLIPRYLFSGQSEFLGLSPSSIWVADGLSQITKLECVA